MDNVSDPTDFPTDTEAPGLRKLDAAFSCQICGEVYDAPMMLGCGHSFCSICVRRSLRDRHECPACRNPAEEVQLVKNTHLEDLCDSWRSARDTILKLIKKVDHLERIVANNGNPDMPPRKKRRVNSEEVKVTSVERGSAEVIDDFDEKLGGEVIPSSDAEENETQIDGHSIVNCPLCGQRVMYGNVNGHMDSDCRSFLAKPKGEHANTKDSWNSILGNGSSISTSRIKGKKQQRETRTDLAGHVERIPKPSYKLLKDKKLREMLAEYQLSTSGAREQLIARHTQFVLLYNSNLDRTERLRKSLSELRNELKGWEDNLELKKVSVDDPQTYMKDRSAEFKKHIEAAKASNLTKKGKDSSSPSTSSMAPGSSESSARPGDVTTNIDAPAVDRRNAPREGAIVVPDSQEEAI
ncbi:RAD18 [Sanghuangporus sanghuang]